MSGESHIFKEPKLSEDPNLKEFEFMVDGEFVLGAKIVRSGGYWYRVHLYTLDKEEKDLLISFTGQKPDYYFAIKREHFLYNRGSGSVIYSNRTDGDNIRNYRINVEFTGIISDDPIVSITYVRI